jgi:2-polyprenyl-3-methyl-5-hydroxy-6-metoxy-1,4-benzoquinol methylase
MQEKLPTPDSPSVEQPCLDIKRGLLKLLLAFASHNKDAWNLDDGKAAPPAFSVIEIDNWKEALALWISLGQPLLADLPARACPACDSSVSHTVFQSYDGYHYNECERCGTWYVPLSVDWALFERFFAECPPARAVARKATTGRMEQSDNPDFSRFGNYFRSILDILSTPRSQPRYLDIGCGVGHALTAAKTAGMLPHGVEVDPDAVALAKRNHDVVVGSVEDLPVGTYDVVSMWETLEHLADPLLMLREAVARLSPGGLVVVTVPNLDATGLRVSREKCSYVYGGFNSPGHINFFNHRTVEMLFKRAGLALVDVTYEFSTNSLELVGYLGGVAAADRPFAMAAPPQPVAEVLNLIWPAVTLLEEFAGTLPIMHCIACRLEDVSLFSKKCDERLTIRREHLFMATHDQLVTLNDPVQQLQELTEQYIKMNDYSHEVHDHLQAEINKRDTLIKETRDHLQAEVNKRDEMLAELQRKLNERS